MKKVSESSVQSVRPSNHGVLLAIAGHAIVVGPLPDGPFTVRMEPAAGLMKPAGILNWSKEVAVVERRALTASVVKACQLVLPEERVDRANFALTYEAARKAPLVAVDSVCEACLRGAGVVVYTVGFDRTSGCLFVLSSEGVSVQGDVYQALSSSVDEGSESLDACLDGLIDRILCYLTGGVLTELSVELAAALPAVTVREIGPSDTGGGLNGADKASFAEGQNLAKLVQMEAFLSEHQAACERMGGGCDEFVDTLARAQKAAQPRTSVALFGEATLQTQGPLTLQLSGDTSSESVLSLAARQRWTVAGAIGEPAPRPKQITQPREPCTKPAQATESSNTRAVKSAEPEKLPEIETEKIAASARTPRAAEPAPPPEITARKVHRPAPQQVVPPQSSATAVASLGSTRQNEMTEQSPPSRPDEPSDSPPKSVKTASAAPSSDTGAVSGGAADDAAVSQAPADAGRTENRAEKPAQADAPADSAPRDMPPIEQERRLFQVQTSSPTPQPSPTDEPSQPVRDTAGPEVGADAVASSAADPASKAATDTEVKGESHGATGLVDTSELQALPASLPEPATATSAEAEESTDPNAVPPIPPVSENKKSMIFGVVVTIIVLALFVLWAMR